MAGPIQFGFKVGDAEGGGGDCFFDAVAKGMNLLNARNAFNVTCLRQLCKIFATRSRADGSWLGWLKGALENEGQSIQYYIANIEYCSNDFQVGKSPNELKNPIFGRPEIEGRIICGMHNVRLHIVDKHVMDNENGHQVIDKTGSKLVNEVRYDAEDMVHILNEGGLRFKPILRENPKNWPPSSGATYVTQEHLRESDGIRSKHDTVHSVPPDETNQVAIEDANPNMKPESEERKSGKTQAVVPLHLHALDMMYAKVYEDVPVSNLVEALSSSRDDRMFVISGITQTDDGEMEDELVKVLRVRDPRLACKIKWRACDGSIAFLRNECKQDAVQNFRQICSKNCDKVVYWFEITSSGKSLQLQVYDPNFYLKRSFRCIGKRRIKHLCDEAQFCKKPNDVVILTYRSGMGISTALASLTSQLMHTNWIIRVNLEDCADAITAIPLKENSYNITCEDVYNFLSQIKGTGFPNHDLKELFCHKLRKDVRQPPHILIIFDGFAKANQEIKVVQFFRFLKSYTSAKIWVTTTPDRETYLEMMLKVDGTWLEEVSVPQSVQFLCNFWRVQFGITYEVQTFGNRLVKYSKDLLHKAMQIMNQNAPQLAGSSLLLRMLAEGFQSEALKRCRVNTGNYCHNNSLTFADIYEKLINERCRIIVKEESWYGGMHLGDCDSSKCLETDCGLKTLQQMFPKHVQEFRKVIANFNDQLVKDTEILVDAVEGNSTKIISTPRDCSSELQEDLQGRTALHLVALQGHYSVVSALLDNGYDAFRSDASGRTPLHHAVMCGRYHVVNLLTRYNADIDINDHVFAKMLDTNVIGDSIFLDSKYDNSKLVTWVNKKDSHGKTCLHYAVEDGDWRIACTLLLNGARIRGIGKDTKRELLAYVAGVPADSHYPLYALLLADVPNIVNELAAKIPRHRTWKEFCNSCVIDNEYQVLVEHAFRQGRVEVIDAILGRIKSKDMKSRILGLIDQKGKLLDVVNVNSELSDHEHLKAARYCVECHKRTYYSSMMMARNARSAARHGHLETLKYYLGKADYDWVKPYVMHEAIDANQLFIVGYLWDNYRTDIVPCPPSHNTALHTAAMKGKLNLVKYFVHNGADVHALNELGETPVHLAADGFHLDVVQYLLANGSHFDIHDYCERRLSEVSIGSRRHDATDEVDMVKYLLEESKRSSGWKESKYGEIIWVVKLGNVNGANEDGTTILQEAAAMMPPSFVRYLLARGADLYRTNEKGETVLHFAAQNDKSHGEVVKILLENGAIYDMKDYETKRSASDYMKLCQNTSAIPLLEFIDSMFSNVNQVTCTKLDREDQEAAFNARNHKLNTVLHLAAEANRIDVVEFVLKEDRPSRRADCLNASNEWQDTPLHVACSKGHIEIVELLLRKGAIFNSSNCFNHTPKELAGESGHEDIVQLLQSVEELFATSVENGMIAEKGIGKEYVDVKDKRGKAMLHWASQRGHKDLAEWLLKNGANVGASDTRGRTPLQWAAKYGQNQMCMVLFEYGAMFDTANGEWMTAKDIDESRRCEVLHSVCRLFAYLNYDLPQRVLQILMEIKENKPEYLLAVVSVRDSRGNTLLHVAARGAHCDITLFLLKHGAAYNARTLKCETPETLSPIPDIKLLMKLIKQLFDWKSKLMYPLHVIEQDHLEILKVIRDVRDVHGRTILHAAANVKPPDYFRLKFFVKHSANVNARDRRGQSVLDYAINFENLELVMFLLKNGGDVSSVNLENKEKLFAMANYFGRQDVAEYFESF